MRCQAVDTSRENRIMPRFNMRRNLRALAALVLTMTATALAAERWSDDFRTTDQLHALVNVAPRRAFPRIPTRPDVRLNAADPTKFMSSDGSQPLGHGWFPVIRRLHDGTLLCAHREGVEHGMAQKEARAVVERSTDGGRTWSEPTVILQRPGWAISVMQIEQLGDGSIWANLRMLELGKSWAAAVMRSTDGGDTWAQVSDKGGYIACEMSNGELLWLIGGPPDAAPEDRWASVRATRTSRWVDGKVVWSEDRVHPELGPTADEWMVAETDRPGELVAMMRQQQHSHYYATAKSYDYGYTWTPWRDSNVFLGPIPCRPSIRSMPDGRLIFSYGQRWIGRTFAVISRDRGETWDVAHRQVLLHSPWQYHQSWDSHYTDIARAEDGLWLGIDYIASPRDREKQRGIYGTFVDERFFENAYSGLQLAWTRPPCFYGSVGLWRFDEAAGQFARDDINGNYGEINGALRTDGRLRGGLSFDGNDDHILIFDDATLRVPRYFGVSAWIKPEDPAREQTIISKAPAWSLVLRDGVPVLEVGKGHGQAARAQPLEPNRWTHVAATICMRSWYTRITLFVDGREVGNVKPADAEGRDYYAAEYEDAAVMTDRRMAGADPRFQEHARRKIRSTDCLVIGMDNNLGTRPFRGVIDEVLLHGAPLKPSLYRLAYQRDIAEQGRATSLPIRRAPGANWTTFDARVTQAEHVRFALLDAEGKILLPDLEPGADLSSIAADTVVLQATFNRAAVGQTPVLQEWSLGAAPVAPTVWRRPVPDQTAALTATKSAAGQPLMKRVAAVPENALRIGPVESGYVELYRVPLSSSGTIEFDLDRDPADIGKAWLELTVDDIDDPKEAVIVLNDEHRIEVNASVLGEGDGYSGALVVPVTALKRGRNVFKFTFADNLQGTTEGFTIQAAVLAVLPKELLPL